MGMESMNLWLAVVKMVINILVPLKEVNVLACRLLN